MENINTDTEHEVRNSINKKRKGGRPKLIEFERRRNTTRVGFNDSEFDKLEIRAEKVGLDLSEFVRRLALDKEFNSIPAINKTALVELNKIGNNINQIAHALNKNAETPTALNHTLAQLQNQLQKIGLQLNGIHESEH